MKNPSVKTPEVQAWNRLVADDFSGTWCSLRDESVYADLSSLGASTDKFALVVDNNLQAAAAILLLKDLSHLDVVVVPRAKFTDVVSSKIADVGYTAYDSKGHVLTNALPSGDASPGSITLLTSGTTGVPKLVRHTLSTLFTACRSKFDCHRRWLVPYQTATYAWYQLVTQGMFGPEQHLVFSEDSDLQEIFHRASSQGVDSISATPTFWRLALMQLTNEALQSVPLKQITLGGELVDQPILDQLAGVYPSADIVHIYASTEVGTCIVVKDKMAGFPSSFIDRKTMDLPSVRINDGVLQVRSPFAGVSSNALGGSDLSWINTGDLVELRGDRVYFCGRSDRAIINVGGSKAFPADIESVLHAHPSVLWCRVRAVRAPLVGYLPEADVVLKPTADLPSELELTKFCATRLPEFAIPRFWNFLPAIPVEDSLKSRI